MRDPMTRDMLARSAGEAHSDAVASTGTTAKRWGVTTRAARYWAKGGPPAVREFFNYLLRTDEPWQVVAEAERLVKRRAVQKLATSALVSRYCELMALDKRQEAEETVASLDWHTGWREIARAHRIDAAYDLELAAICSELEKRRVTRLEVMHG